MLAAPTWAALLSTMGHLYFLFGDTPHIPGTHDDRDDFLAWTDATSPEDVALNVRCVAELRVLKSASRSVPPTQ